MTKKIKWKSGNPDFYVHYEEPRGTDFLLCGVGIDGSPNAVETNRSVNCPECIKTLLQYKNIRLPLNWKKIVGYK